MHQVLLLQVLSTSTQICLKQEYSRLTKLVLLEVFMVVRWIWSGTVVENVRITRLTTLEMLLRTWFIWTVSLSPTTSNEVADVAFARTMMVERRPSFSSKLPAVYTPALTSELGSERHFSIFQALAVMMVDIFDVMTYVWIIFVHCVVSSVLIHKWWWNGQSFRGMSVLSVIHMHTHTHTHTPTVNRSAAG